jgi:hypothetical protein
LAIYQVPCSISCDGFVGLEHEDTEARFADRCSTNPLRIGEPPVQIAGTIKKITITADDITKSKILLFGRRSSAVFPKCWWEILKRHRSFQQGASVLLQLSGEVHDDPIQSQQLVIAFCQMQLKFDRQNAKTAKQDMESVQQKLSQAKETIEKMRSETEPGKKSIRQLRRGHVHRNPGSPN